MLSFDDKMRIHHEVVLDVLPPKDEPSEQKDWREKTTRGVKAVMDAGYMPDCPLDWD